VKKFRIVERTNKKGYKTYHIQDKIKYIPWSWRDVEGCEHGYDTIEAAIHALLSKYAPPIIEGEKVVYTNFKKFDC
jgi:hypothetical protein